ncbi:MAG: hypothetical protein ABI444_14800, partial [Candidatus Kapaibacterium sp.]
QTSRGGGAKDLANGSFTVRVNKLEPANVSRFYPENAKTHVGTPYTGIVFKANGKFASLDGSYRMELDLNGTKVAEKDEPTVEYTPEFLKDEGKKLEVKTYYKSPFMKSYVQIDDQVFTVAPPPLIVGSSGDLTAGDPLDFKVALGVPGAYSELGADHVDIESDGYFESTAKKLMDGASGKHFSFEAKMMGKANGIRDKAGKPVHVIVHDPISGRSDAFDIMIYPKVQTKGRGGSGGGGGIH